MRICDVCKLGKWQGRKKDGKFICVDCLAKKDQKKDEKKEE
jgi:uncharacterized Zn finger protein (UPF0148 family)